MNKLLIISGPTATGKTDLAVRIAKKYNGEIISADSRQIYRGMDIGTGKDHPKNIKIHLIDIINPDEKFSVAQYQKLALTKITEIQNKNKLPIIVGGTGLYIDSVINHKPTFDIKPNYFLRFFLDRLPIFILQKIYFILDKKNYLTLNNSDVNNSRRLIRRIEIKLSNKNSLLKGTSFPNDKGFCILHISLTDSIENIIKKIDTRIQSRLKAGLINEIKNLLKKYKWSDPGLNTLAYKEFVGTDLVSALHKEIQVWQIHEHQYARRQKTWFKKFTPDFFIDISKPDYQDKINNIVTKWYNKNI